MDKKTLLKEKIQKKVLTLIGSKHGLSVELGTGVGKTMLGLKHMLQNYTDYCAFLVIVPKLSIKQGWLDQMKEHNFEYLIPHITFSTYRSLHKQSLNFDWVYADECHSITQSNLSWFDKYVLNKGKILGLTGTYPKSGDKKQMCDQYMPKIYEYSVDQGAEDGMLNNYKIFVHMLSLNKHPTLVKKNKNGGQWKTTEIKDYYGLSSSIDNAFGKKQLMLRLYRMKSMQQYQTKVDYVKVILNKIPKKTLVFANTKEQADTISNHSVYSGNPNSKLNLQMFSEDKIYRLSCIEQLSEGVNISNLQVGIIMHAHSNDTKTRQRIGRFLRLVVNKTAVIHILCYKNTIDEQWVKNSLASFDQTKIKYYTP